VTLILWFIRVLILLLIVRFVVTMVRQAMARRGGANPRERVPRRSPERIGGTLVQDPQCGTYLPRDRALEVTAGGTTHYFCSDRCRDEWNRKSA
jgi:YHS domain-containing protein